MKTTILPTITTKNRTKTTFKSTIGVAGQLLSWATMKRRFVFVALILATFAFSAQVRAACREGCDFTYINTFLGDYALNSNTTGVNNTAIGSYALYGNMTGNENTAI